MSFWRRCSACKKEIPLGGAYYVCSVSGCNKKSRPSQYCSVSCWDAHNAVMRHREGGALAQKAPLVSDSEPRLIRPEGSKPLENSQNPEEEILVVVSKMKKYIADKHGMNTSSEVMTILSATLRQIADEAVLRARREGRKTVLDRDIPNIEAFK